MRSIAMASSTANPVQYADMKSAARVREDGCGVCFEVCARAGRSQRSCSASPPPCTGSDVYRERRGRTFISIWRLWTFMRTWRPHSSTKGV